MKRKLTARESAARQCCLSRQTKKTLAIKLRAKGFSEEDIEASVEAMAENGYINDDEYAKAFVKDCYIIKKYGHKKILNELVMRGIDKEKAERAINDYGADEVECIKNAMEKRFDRETEKNKIFKFFLSRGFDADDIRRCIDE